MSFAPRAWSRSSISVRSASGVSGGDATSGAAPQQSGYTVAEATPYCTAHYCVHYVTSTEDAPDPTDGNGNGVPDYVETTAAAAEYSHSVENGQLGWREPKGDGTIGGNVDK